MGKALPLSDFRARRYVLEADDFALSDGGPETPPTDLIPENDWHAIMDLPGDVAIRTTSHQGTRIAVLHHLISAWTEAFPPSPSIIDHGMLDTYDAFQASLFNMLHGFYKEAIASLRNALETMTFAATCAVANDTAAWAGWAGGDELWFGKQCDRLQNLPPVGALERKVRDAFSLSMFLGDGSDVRKAWARNLYRRHCEFAHARGNASNAELWESNGPIYSAKGFRVAFRTFLETHGLCLLLAKLGDPALQFTDTAQGALRPANVKEYVDGPYNALCDFYVLELFGASLEAP
jgi:hypothetical protein